MTHWTIHTSVRFCHTVLKSFQCWLIRFFSFFMTSESKLWLSSFPFLLLFLCALHTFQGESDQNTGTSVFKIWTHCRLKKCHDWCLFLFSISFLIIPNPILHSECNWSLRCHPFGTHKWLNSSKTFLSVWQPVMLAKCVLSCRESHRICLKLFHIGNKLMAICSNGVLLSMPLRLLWCGCLLVLQLAKYYPYHGFHPKRAAIDEWKKSLLLLLLQLPLCLKWSTSVFKAHTRSK